jgi:hypothetical protein
MTEERFQKLEATVAKLESKPKDGWDITQILLGLLTPVAIGFAGFLFSSATERTQQALEARMLEYEQLKDAQQQTYQRERDVQDDKRSDTQLRLSQSETFTQLLDALAGTDQKRKELAIQIALLTPPDGKKLVEAISKAPDTQPAESIQKFATDSLQKRRDELVRLVFSPVQRERARGYTLVSEQWASDFTLLQQLFARAQKSMDDVNGIFQFTALLPELSPDVLLPMKAEILAFLDQIPKTPDRKQTQANADQIRKLYARISK